jgi:hypothetical protein
MFQITFDEIQSCIFVNELLYEKPVSVERICVRYLYIGLYKPRLLDRR